MLFKISGVGVHIEECFLISRTCPIFRMLKINNVSEEKKNVIMGKVLSVEKASRNIFMMFRRITFINGHKEYEINSHSTFDERNNNQRIVFFFSRIFFRASLTSLFLRE